MRYSNVRMCVSWRPHCIAIEGHIVSIYLFGWYFNIQNWSLTSAGPCLVNQRHCSLILWPAQRHKQMSENDEVQLDRSLFLGFDDYPYCTWKSLRNILELMLWEIISDQKCWRGSQFMPWDNLYLTTCFTINCRNYTQKGRLWSINSRRFRGAPRLSIVTPLIGHPEYSKRHPSMYCFPDASPAPLSDSYNHRV